MSGGIGKALLLWAADEVKPNATNRRILLMQSPKRAVLYGIAVWLLALLVSMIIFPLKASWPALLAVVFCHLYFRRCAGDFLREGAWLGATWLGINLLFDLPLFSWGPMKV